MSGSSASAQVVSSALQQLNWISADFDLCSDSHGETYGGSGANCWLEWTACIKSRGFDSNSETNSLPKSKLASHSAQPSEILARLQELHRDGWVLWDRWPRDTHATVEAWLGPRLYLFSPSAHRLLAEKLHAIVCSQMGRDHRNIPCWPTLLDWALRAAQRDSASVIVADGITLDAPTRQFARAADVPLIELKLEKPFQLGEQSTKRLHAEPRDSEPKPTNGGVNPAAVEWLTNSLVHLVACADSTSSSEQCIWISPVLSDQVQEDTEKSDTNANTNPLAKTPLRDRACVALADRVSAVSIKPSGTIAKLLQNRLSDSTFPTASCFVAIPNYRYSAKQDWKSHSAWLDRGAVGYIVDIEAGVGLNNQLGRCNLVSGNATLQPCLSLSKWIQQQRGPWSYLTHCTRGNSAAWPQESMEGFVRRVWNDGQSIASDPFLTLMNILQDRCLRGSNWMTRTQTPMVSLSAAPIIDLLARRTFRAHLNRWDWEPYGIAFRHAYIADAHAVTYGPKSTLENLPAEMQLFYQPNDGRQDWSDEQEYRVVGNIDLAALPSHAAFVFTQTELEARQAAAISPFPVIWVRGTENGN